MNDLGKRKAVCEEKLLEVSLPSEENQKNVVIHRNFLVIQTLRTEIAFICSKLSLLAYDQQQLFTGTRRIKSICSYPLTLLLFLIHTYFSFFFLFSSWILCLVNLYYGTIN